MSISMKIIGIVIVREGGRVFSGCRLRKWIKCTSCACKITYYCPYRRSLHGIRKTRASRIGLFRKIFHWYNVFSECAFFLTFFVLYFHFSTIGVQINILFAFAIGANLSWIFFLWRKNVFFIYRYSRAHKHRNVHANIIFGIIEHVNALTCCKRMCTRKCKLLL